MTKLKLLRKFILISVLCLIFFPLSVFAESTSDASLASNYTVIPHFGESQVQASTSFYDMVLSPNQSDHFSLSLINQTDKSQKYKISINTATTNDNVIVDYTKDQFKKDPSMALELSNFITPKIEEVTLSAKEQKKLDFEIKAPVKEFNGILLGSLVVRPMTSDQTDAGIKNVFLHTIAIRLKENDNPVPAKLEGGTVILGQENLHNIISMSLRNPQSVLMSHVQGTFTINKTNSKEKLIEVRKKDLSIAPNSCFKIPVQLNDQFKAGRYEYTVHLSNSQGTWTFKKAFTIKKSTADYYNKTAVTQRKTSSNLWLIFVLVMIILALGTLIIYLVVIQKKRDHSKK